MNTLLKTIFIYFFIIGFLNAKAQCDVRITPDVSEICWGDSLMLKAEGGCGVALFIDFNDSTMQGLQSNAAQLIGKPCASSPDNSPYLWVGTAGGQNLIYTQPLDLSAGLFQLSYNLVFGEEGAGGICDGPAIATEALQVDYSTNNGATWTTLETYDPNGGHDPNRIQWQSILINLPAGAQTAATMFRWTQTSVTTANTANWGIDQIIIKRNLPVQFLWSTGFAGKNHPPLYPNNNITYSVTATYANQSVSDSIHVTVYPRPSSSFSHSYPLCRSTLIDFFQGTSANPNLTYHWNIQSPNQVFDTNTFNSKALWNSSGQYYVSLMVRDAHCKSIPTKKEILIEPLISFYISTSQGCVPLSVSFTGNVEPPNSSYFWDFHDGNTSNQANPTHTYTVAGDYGLTLIALTDSGCSDTSTFNLITKVWPNPLPDFSFSPSIVPWSNPTANFLNLTSGGAVYEWNFGDFGSGNNISYLFNPDHVFSEKGLFTVSLIATSDHGCMDSIMKQIRVEDDVFELPNIITPNGDGFNEKLIITNFESLKNCQIEIYNRWGKIVFQTTNYQNDFDANNLSDGVYYYSIKYESWFGSAESYGFFHVLRK
ncbi:MAG: gliding motility-associated C-terminal domain-containing protein [Bacteroidales bacterium]|nr:gliding motility-associated C-terminal domain-containing protein [Bacteroidales bacterium]